MNNNNINVTVLMGGPSAERKVSLESGRAAAQALREAGWPVELVDVRGPDFRLPRDTDVAFLALHGTFGEDGQIQRLLEERGVCYTGSGPEASARAFDKSAAKTAFVAAGIPTPPPATQPPLVVKPARQGSSVGVTIVRAESELKSACRLARRFDECVVLEQFIAGRELTVGILGGRALPVVEIRTKHGVFDYAAKYTPGEAEEIVPAPLETLLTARVQALALRAHDCLGCRDVSRVDLILSDAGELFVLEVNTLPGLTANSLLPKAARADRLSMAEVCGQLVERALARRLEAVAA